MRQISVLDQNTIDKIAAGEVVERPASVVKELVENAIDAGASAITVEIKNGGISKIRITDNGSGIEEEQVPLAFLRHATSKIRKVDDLLSISSLGFRGEALSSIAAVAQVQMLTKTRGKLEGIRYVIEGGTEKSMETVGTPEGTTFIVENLFYNTPARAKFLKTPATEAGYISSFIQQLALSHPYISFKYILDNQTKLHTSGNNNLKEVIYQIYGREITKELIAIDDSDEESGLQITGFIGKPTVSRGNRNFENYYVNGRYVKSKIITKAIEDAYHTFMMQHKYPFTAFCLNINGDEVDINVHPTKMEVRFSDQEQVYRRVFHAVQNGLSHRELIPQVSVGPEKKSEKKPENKPIPRPVQAPEPFEYKRRQLEQRSTEIHRQPPPPSEIKAAQQDNIPDTDVVRETFSYHTNSRHSYSMASGGLDARSQKPPVNFTDKESKIEKSTLPETPPAVLPDEMPAAESNRKPDEKPDIKPDIKPEQLELFDGILLSAEAKKHHKIIGQVFDTYWLVQMEDKLYIIDQHAAHEKVLYERIVKEMKERRVTSQLLSPPMIISLNLQERDKLHTYMDVFTSLGFEIEVFGGQEYSVRAVPQNLYGLTREDFFIEILDHLEETPTSKTLEVLSDRMATMACKAAVKGNQQLTVQEASALIDELLKLDNPYNCPHGRPTIISMTKYELEKKFKRIV